MLFVPRQMWSLSTCPMYIGLKWPNFNRNGPTADVQSFSFSRSYFMNIE
jgi:hypothetical protein